MYTHIHAHIERHITECRDHTICYKVAAPGGQISEPCAESPYLSACAYTYTCMCISLSLYIYIYIYLYVYVYIYT